MKEDFADTRVMGVSSNEPFVVKILKCESDDWYKDKIGEYIVVARFGTFGVHTSDGKHISMFDVEVFDNI